MKKTMFSPDRCNGCIAAYNSSCAADECYGCFVRFSLLGHQLTKEQCRDAYKISAAMFREDFGTTDDTEE